MSDSKNLELLQEENDKLKSKNEKLYRDCVSFAKRIKALEDIEARLSDLEKENEDLKSEIVRLSSTERPAEYVSESPIKVIKATIAEETVETVETPEPTIMEEPVFNPVPEVSSIEDTPSFAAAFVPEETAAPSPAPVTYEPVDATNTIPTNHSTHKYNPFITIIRTILWIFFIVSTIVGLVSAVSYIFCTNYADYSIAGYRFATVKNSAMSPDYTTDSVVLVKYQGFDGIPIESSVVTTKNGQSIAKLESIDQINGENIATVSDKNGTYTVTEKQFVGCVQFKIPYVALVVQYACTHQYNYLAICASSILVSLALILLIPSNKARAPKFGKDYGVEEFTI